VRKITALIRVLVIWALSWLFVEGGEGMDDVTLKDILMRQGRALSVLAIRITTLEKLLLEKES
jgi:hypothetical protein